MSYVDTGDDELDYGEDELGDRDAALTSFQPGAAISALVDYKLVQDEDYEDLYDDVNIGYFQSPPVEPPKQRVVDAGNAFGLEYDEEDAYKRTEGRLSGAHADEHRMEQGVEARALPESAPVTVSELHIKLEEIKDAKKEPVEDMALEHGAPNLLLTEGRNYSYAGQFKEATSLLSIPANAKEGRDEGTQMGRSILSSRPKEQSDRYSNSPGHRTNQLDKSISPNKDKENRGARALTPSGNGEAISGSAQILSGTTYESAGFAGEGFSVGPGKPRSANAKGRDDAVDMSLDAARGTSAVLSRPSQVGTNRDSSPNLVNDFTPSHTGQQSYSGDGGGTMLFIGDLHWWTTDAELEATLSEFGRLKNLKFFEERVSGKSKGYCQVEFYDHAAAIACKQGMNGRNFHDRRCLVALGNTRSIQQMGFAQERKTHSQFQAQQAQTANRRTTNDTGVARGGSSYQERETNRSYGRTGTGGRTGQGQGMSSKGGQTGSGRGRGNYMGKGMTGGGAVGGPYSQGHSGPMGGHQPGMMMHQGIMGQGYDPGYGPPMGRGGVAYGGYLMPAPPFSGMVQPFSGVGPGGLPGIAPHINPAFFGRSTTGNGIGMMPGGGVEGPHQGMWGEATMSGWGGEEHDRRTRDGSYSEDVGGMDYGYSTEMGHEKHRTSVGREKENGDWIERRRRDDREADWERERYRERDKDGYRDQRDRERDREKDDDWERDRSVRMRDKGRMVEDEDQRLRSREEEYGKRRHVAVER